MTITREFTKEQAQKIIDAADEVITALAGTNEDVHPDNSTKMCAAWDELNDHYAPPEVVRELARIALASLEAEPVGYMNRFTGRVFTLEEQPGADTDVQVYVPVYTVPPAPVSVPEFAPIAYIFKHPSGRLFWSLTDESNKGQSDVMPVYSAPVPAFVPSAIEPDYEVIKGILPTSNPDEYACCIAADMWNACRASMLQAGNSQVILDGWVAVPVEPTAEMMAEAKRWTGLTSTAEIVYREMLAAAPQQEPE